MKREMKTRALSLILLTVMLVAAVLALGGCPSLEDPFDATVIERKTLGTGDKTITFTMVNAQNRAIVHTIHTNATTLRAALDEHSLADGEGTMITVVCGIRADYVKDGMWWKLYVGREEASTGADGVPLTDGGDYTFVCTPAY